MKSAFYILFFLMITVFGSYGQGSKAIDNPGHQQQLSDLKKLAADDMAKNLNRFALNKLQQYDKLLDTLFSNEKRDTIAAIQQKAGAENRNLNNTSSTLKSQIENLKTSNLKLENSGNGLLSKCSFFFIILVIVLLIILYSRKKLGYRYEMLLNSNRQKVKSAENQSSKAEGLIEKATGNREILETIRNNTAELNALINQLKAITDSDNVELEPASSNALEISAITNEQLNLNEALLEYKKEGVQDKIPADINKICALFAALVQKAAPGEKISADLEKNKLPDVKMNPAEIGNLLLHVLTNSLQSVRAKAARNIKGYVPQVSISTRLLPRFVQVRVHDNGDGIPDKEMELVYNQFYSVDQNADASGLGLYISKQTMEDHKGEIKMESDKLRGTDVYLKFFKS